MPQRWRLSIRWIMAQIAIVAVFLAACLWDAKEKARPGERIGGGVASLIVVGEGMYLCRALLQRSLSG